MQIGKAINTENATNSKEIEREKKNSRIDKIFRGENYCSLREEVWESTRFFAGTRRNLTMTIFY